MDELSSKILLYVLGEWTLTRDPHTPNPADLAPNPLRHPRPLCKCKKDRHRRARMLEAREAPSGMQPLAGKAKPT